MCEEPQIETLYWKTNHVLFEIKGDLKQIFVVEILQIYKIVMRDTKSRKPHQNIPNSNQIMKVLIL